jgi:hypothetical protein
MKMIKSKLRNILGAERLEGCFACGQILRNLCTETACKLLMDFLLLEEIWLIVIILLAALTGLRGL